MLSRKERPPFHLLLIFLILFCGMLAFFWIKQGASNKELLANYAKMVDYFEGMKSVGGWPWWTPHYNSGHSMADSMGTIITYVLMLVGSILGGVVAQPAMIVGPKLVGIAMMFLSAVAMFFFMRRLNPDPWCALVSSIFYAMCPQFALRLAYSEHMVVAFCFLYPPLIFLALLNIAEKNRWRDALLLALSYGAMTLTYVRTAVVFLPAIFIFALWILLTKKERSSHLFVGTLRASLLYFPLAVFPLLPLIREMGWITLFSTDPFQGWQMNFSMKTVLSWLDQGGKLLAPMPPYFTIDAGGFYVGLVSILLFSTLFLYTQKRAKWLASLNGGQFRFFLALAFFLVWLAYGPRSVVKGHLEFLNGAQNMPDWSIPIVWFLLFAQGFMLAMLWPANVRWRVGWIALTLAIYFFVPGFSIIEKIPFYDRIRAPWFFWEVGGSFALAAGIGLIAPMILRDLIKTPFLRTIACLLLLAIALLDQSIYYARFTSGELSKGTFEDFKKTEQVLSEQNQPGKVFFISGRYFYLLTPMMSNRGLMLEAFHGHFMLKWTRYLILAGAGVPDFLRTQLNLMGISHIALDEQDPDTPQELQKFYRDLFPSTFQSSHFTVLSNPDCLAPAFIGKEWVAVESDTPEQNQQLLTLARLNYVSVKQTSIDQSQADLIGVLRPKSPLEIKPEYTNQTGTPFQIHSTVLPRRNFHEIKVVQLAGKQGWLTICESYHPDWRAYANDKKVPVHQAFGALLTARIPQDAQEMIFRFEPPRWYSGLLTISSVFWLFSLAALITLSNHKKRHAK
ncbi:MAG: hypothetical protein ACOY3I_06165 [Verrucomicrobiota bacterium]